MNKKYLKFYMLFLSIVSIICLLFGVIWYFVKWEPQCLFTSFMMVMVAIVLYFLCFFRGIIFLKNFKKNRKYLLIFLFIIINLLQYSLLIIIILITNYFDIFNFYMSLTCVLIYSLGIITNSIILKNE